MNSHLRHLQPIVLDAGTEPQKSFSLNYVLLKFIFTFTPSALRYKSHMHPFNSNVSFSTLPQKNKEVKNRGSRKIYTDCMMHYSETESVPDGKDRANMTPSGDITLTDPPRRLCVQQM